MDLRYGLVDLGDIKEPGKKLAKRKIKQDSNGR